jgi:hypothetical protein
MARYLPAGHIVYQLANNNNLFAIPFDLDRLAVAGGPVPIVEGVFSSSLVSQFAISESGTLVYIPGAAGAAASSERSLVWVSRDGHEDPLKAPPNFYRFPKISPDGTKLALSIVEGETMHMIVDQTYATGKLEHVEYTAKLDGKEYPVKVSPPSPGPYTISLKLINPRTREFVENIGKRTIKGEDVLF